VKKYIYSSYIITFFAMCFTATSLAIFPEFFIRIFTDDPKVIELGLTLFVIVALFQLFDGAQVIIAGALRGLGVTREVSYSVIIGYWVLGVPVGIWLAF